MLEILRIIIAVILTLAFLTAVLVLSWKSFPVHHVPPDTVGDLIDSDYSKYFWVGVAVISAVGWVVWKRRKRGSNGENREGRDDEA